MKKHLVAGLSGLLLVGFGITELAQAGTPGWGGERSGSQGRDADTRHAFDRPETRERPFTPSPGVACPPIPPQCDRRFVPHGPPPRPVYRPMPRCEPVPTGPIIRHLGNGRRIYQLPIPGHPAYVQV